VGQGMNLQLAKQLLGIEYRVTIAELKTIYRQKAISLHPDVNKSSTASEDFRNLNTAYQFLTKNLNQLHPKPPPKPTCPIIYRVLPGKLVENVEVPYQALEEDDLCIHYKWKNMEYRTVFKKGLKLPARVKIDGIDLTIVLTEERPWGP